MTGVRLVQLAGAALPILLALLLWLWVRRRRRVADAFGDAALLTRLLGLDLRRTPAGVVALLLLAAIALGAAVAAAAPTLSAPREAPAGGPVVLVLDVSNSMLARDLAPDRLEALRDAGRRLADGLPERELGLVVFAGRAFALSPPTPDRGAIELYLRALHPEMVSQTGSTIAGALRQGIGLLAASVEEGRPGALVLISDGDEVDESGDLAEAVGLARRAGVTVHALGAATPAGAPVPLPVGAAAAPPGVGTARGYMRAPDGSLVITRLGEELLRSIAEGTGGTYAPLTDPSAVPLLLRELGAAEEDGPGTPRLPLYAWLAGLALLLLAFDHARAPVPEEPA